MKPTIALLLALFTAACGGEPDDSTHMPTAPSMPTAPGIAGNQVDGGQWMQRAPLIEPNSELPLAMS